MEQREVRSLVGGATQQGVRNHNERLLLSLIQRHDMIPGSDLARLAGLSPQTVSVILRQLEEEGLVARGAPQRGRVGKPSVPMGLAADGVYSFGLKIGRRSADLVLTDFRGQVRGAVQTTYRYPLPGDILAFLRAGMERLTRGMTADARRRIAGIGIARPYEIWTWHDSLGAPTEALDDWRHTDFAAEIAAFSDLPVHQQNDATAACRAEHVYGLGRAWRDYAYFFVGAFIGGGLVINHSVFEGARGNAASFGSLPARRADGTECQLIDAASLHLLEAEVMAAGFPPAVLWTQPQDWSAIDAEVERWIAHAAREIAGACAAVAAVIDIEAVLVDGGFPPGVRDRLVQAIRAALPGIDLRGTSPFTVAGGTIGGQARALGAASGPVFARFFLDTHANP